MNAREMEIQGDKVILNGFVVSLERANTIMFVQCTVLRKPYSIDTSTTPMSINIEGYAPDENDMKPDSEFKREPRLNEQPKDKEMEEPRQVKKCGSCGGHVK